MDDDLKYVITEEEKTRHDALFYSQSPKNGLLSGEQARSLFIRSRLPLSELSKIWKLSDLTRDNMLDISEFTTAMHLIQLRLRGFDIPDKLPPSLTPSSVKITDIPKITENEMAVYQKTFEWKDKSKTGFIDTETASSIMLSSGLDSYTLARIWNLSDIDRDAKLSNSEFAIALHLLRYCKKGNELDGSIDVKSALPGQFLKDDTEAKKKRHTEVQTERRKLWTIKQKLCSEMSNGLDEKLVNERIRPELNKVEERLTVLEKEETELRRSLLNLKDKTKKESFKPFDRSFLLKKCVCGEDLFKGGRQSELGKDRVVFERLWSAEPLVDDGDINAKNGEDEETRNANYNGVSNDCLQTQPPEIIFTEVKRERSEEKDERLNVTDSVDNSIRSGYKLDTTRTDTTTALKTKERKDTSKTEGKKVDRNESFSWAAVQRRPVIQQTVTEEVLAMPPEKKQQKSLVEETVSLEHRQRGADSTELDEQLKLLGKEPTKYVDVNQNSTSRIENAMKVESTNRLESSNQNMDHLFDKLSDDHGMSNGTDQTYRSQQKSSTKLPVGRVLSVEEEKELIKAGVIKRVQRDQHPRSEPTQEELLPLYLEEKRKAEEERRRRREEEQAKILQAREDLKRQEEEVAQQLLLRKVAIQEAKGKLEKQISQTEHIVPTSNAGRLIEQELAEQRIKDEEARQRIDQFQSHCSNDRLNHEIDGNKIQPKHINIESSPTMEYKPQFTTPVVRKQNPEKITRNKDSRKSWVELEIEQQKMKDEEMRREIEERQKDVNRASHGQNHLHSVKRDIEISEEPIARSSSVRTVESQPTGNAMQKSQMFSQSASRNSTSALSKAAPKPTVPWTGPAVNYSFQGRGIARGFDNVDAGMTAEETEMERKILEEEEQLRIEQIEKIRQESLQREAEELMRQRNLREEELRRKRELLLREADKIKKEEQERQEEALRHAEQRRLAFAAEKVKLEERVIRTMQENVAENATRPRIPSTSSETTQKRANSPTQEEEQVRERRRSVRDSMALFEKQAEQPKVVMRQKRQSLNLDDTTNVSKSSQNPNRASFYSDAVVSKEKKTTNAIQIISLEEQSHSKKPSRLDLGNISSKRQQFETGRQQSVEIEKPQSSFPSSISNTTIQKEMEELQRKEDEIRMRKGGPTRAPKMGQDSLDGIKRNPLPNKTQVKRQAPSIPVSKQGPQQKSAPAKQPTAKKSFIEMEKEKELRREEALQREREAIMKEREAILMRNEVEQDSSKTKDKKRPASGGWLYK